MALKNSASRYVLQLELPRLSEKNAKIFMSSINLALKALNLQYLFSKEEMLPANLSDLYKTYKFQFKSIMQTAIINKIPERYMHHINIESSDSLHLIKEEIKLKNHPLNQQREGRTRTGSAKTRIFARRNSQRILSAMRRASNRAHHSKHHDGRRRRKIHGPGTGLRVRQTR